MAGQLTNSASLSEFDILNARNFHYAIIASEWNSDITERMQNGALLLLSQFKVPIEHIITLHVPGSFELPLAAKWAIDAMKADAVICLGCIIKGETKHDDYIANAVSQGIMQLNMQSGKPVIFGVLTVNNLQQAEDRSGGKLGNKGEEAAITAIKMLSLRNELNR